MLVGTTKKLILSYEGMALWKASRNAQVSVLAGPKVSPITYRVLKGGGGVQGEEVTGEL